MTPLLECSVDLSDRQYCLLVLPNGILNAWLWIGSKIKIPSQNSFQVKKFQVITVIQHVDCEVEIITTALSLGMSSAVLFNSL